MNHTNQHRCIRWLLAFDIILRRNNELAVCQLFVDGKPVSNEPGGAVAKEEKHHG